jgi:glycosyltransferase involved in cell wall biosynthesis
MNFSIIIPCYNEYNNLAKLIKFILPLLENYNLEFILVENGSSDNSRLYFDNFINKKYKNINVIYLDQNKGYGYGLQKGIEISKGKYIGWIHSDLQINVNELKQYFDFILTNNSNVDYFLKGVRKNRKHIDIFFTTAQQIFNSILFNFKMFDIAAIPVLFPKKIITNIDNLPNEFSIELYIYLQAKKMKCIEIRFPVLFFQRENGKSSWNNGILSKFRQSKRIFINSLKIKLNKKVK